ncbi:MAG: hypothetical protein HC933_01395 [Pleurocapsa sp. SU_196_0]|nr:hypothetical protein [Pleurocapsa sp. SU_196_0]
MTKSWTLTFDAKGKLTLPPDLLEHLRWDTGEPVRVTTHGDTLTLERKRALVARVFGSLTPPPEKMAPRTDPAPKPSQDNPPIVTPEVTAHGD